MQFSISEWFVYFVNTVTRKKLALLSYSRPSARSECTAVLPDAVLAKYISAINHDQFVADVQPHICSHHDYRMIRPLIARLIYIPATLATVEPVFSRMPLSQDLTVQR